MKSIGGAGLGVIAGLVFMWLGVFSSAWGESEKVNIRLTIVDPFSAGEEGEADKDADIERSSRGYGIRHSRKSYVRSESSEAPETKGDEGGADDLWESETIREMSIDVVSYYD